MAAYDLKVGFSNKDLETIYATGTNVIIAKPTNGEHPNVAWQVYRPMQANTLYWEENYGIYASTSEVTNGAVLDQLSNIPVPAAMGQVYTLQNNAIITGPASGGTPSAFQLLNKYNEKSYMTIGLYQNANVNGTDILGNALSAAGVMLNSRAVITPYTTIYIWLQSNVRSNCVVTEVYSPMTELKFGGGITSLSVKYDSSTGNFINAGKSDLKLEVRQPLL